MRISRNSDALHLARKRSRSRILRAEIIPLEHVPGTDLEVLTDNPSSIPPPTNPPADPGEP